jgi:hypothetical protein
MMESDWIEAIEDSKTKNAALVFERIRILQEEIDLSKPRGKSKQTELFDEWMLRHKEMLRMYQLPFTQDNLSLFEMFENSGETPNVDFHDLCIFLEARRERYLLSSPRSFKDMLIEGKTDPKTFDLFLGEMRLEHHIYVEFIYNDIWRSEQGNINEVLREFELTVENPDSLNELGLLFFSSKLNEDNASSIVKLKRLGYLYIDKYVQYIRYMLYDEGGE